MQDLGDRQLTDALRVEKLLRQQAAIAQFGSFALREQDLMTILDDAVRVCAEGLGVPFSKVCRYRPDHDDLLIVAGHGWHDGVVGNVVSRADLTSPQGRAFSTGVPSICDDIRGGAYWDLPAFYAAHGVVSIVDVIIKGSADTPYGILEIDSDQHRKFDQYDINFLTGFANVLAEAVATASRAAELQLALDRMHTLVEEKDQALRDKDAADMQLRQAQKMEAIGQLTGGIAHDLNNILTVIIGNIELLADGVTDRPALAALVAMVDLAAARGADLTQRLLAFARKQPLQPRDTDLNSLVGETVELLQSTLGDHVRIETILAPDMPHALIDPSQLTNTILNLALNARDAMGDGGTLTFETSNVVLDEGYAGANPGVTVGAYVLLAVTDSGHGIPADIIHKVCEPFFTTKEVGKGSGLGLSMVYGFVRQSEGHIAIDSEEGRGTTIRIYLPQAAGLVQAAAAASPAEVGRGHEIVLVVEDDELVRNFVVAQVRNLGYVALSTANAEQAMGVLNGPQLIDLLFTDMVMPGSMTGRQLAEQALLLRPTLKVLFTSGYTDGTIIHYGRLDPGVALLAKPYRRAELAQMIRAALDAEPGMRAAVATTSTKGRAAAS
jgi:signal transduction histidine kinase/CheY-like chemotaxis protein